MKSRDVNLNQLLSLGTTKYGVNPLFDIIVDAIGRIGVSHYTFYNTNMFLCICLVSECAYVSDLKQIQVDLPIYKFESFVLLYILNTLPFASAFEVRMALFLFYLFSWMNYEVITRFLCIVLYHFHFF